MISKKTIYKIGKRLEINESEIKTAILKNRNKIVIGLIIFISALTNRVWFEPLHYTVASISDFVFFTRFF
jgi:hypothetical protein